MAIESKRGCGFRKVGGLYLCGDGPVTGCHRLPIPLDVCPTCHGGIKQLRGWTWVLPVLLGGPCPSLSDTFDHQGGWHCQACAACSPEILGEKVGLLWIGDKFYSTKTFLEEASNMGISRRITAIPRGFKVGEHWVLLAHPKAVKRGESAVEVMGGGFTADLYTPGIFQVFKPTKIEKILDSDATPEQVKEWENKGVKVVVVPADDRDHKGSVYDKDDEENGDDPRYLLPPDPLRE